jgi:serine protease Do
MSHNPDVQTPNLTKCLNCHSAMPSELRFCRNCGFRLGEGVAEYNETIRFDGSNIPAATATAIPSARRKRRRMSGMAWVFVALLVFFVGAAAFTAVIAPRHAINVRSGGFTPAIVKPRSYLGVDGFDTADNNAGVTFNSVQTPDSPADKAGLVGGDIITKFDGHDVRDEDQMMELMVETPIGKTVEVEFLRDGDKKTAKLTTISGDENSRLSALFKNRPEGRGQFGFDDGDTEEVEIPGTKLRGLRLDNVLPSRPADLAGIKQGDIVIQFGDTPIRTKEEFLARVRRAIPYTTVNVVVMRGEDNKLEKIEIPVKMGRQ